MKRWQQAFTILPVGLALVLLLLHSCQAEARFSNKYDRYIQQATGKFWPRYVDWIWWKAQLYQESKLDPDAVSPVGAAGLAQFMPGTWADVSKSLGYRRVSPHVAKPAIEAGAYYMMKLVKGWSAPRPTIDRWDLARASYNAGFGNLLKAQRACGNRNLFWEIIECLPKITGKHSEETITYVNRIRAWYRMMKGCRKC